MTKAKKKQIELRDLISDRKETEEQFGKSMCVLKVKKKRGNKVWYEN